LEGGKDYKQQTSTAKEWYARAIALNSHDAYSYLRMGMCQDWLGEHDGSEKYYSEAETRDPNGYYLVADLGWHYVEIGDYAAARQFFVRSLGLYGNSKGNMTAWNYAQICEDRLIDQAAGKVLFPMDIH
jgi:tetratricopeptide (TPR) repeat protein